MSARLPVLSSVKGELGQFLLETQTGLLYDEVDPAALARHICDLYDRPRELEKMSENAYQLFKAEFVAEEIYATMANHLAEMVSDWRENRKQDVARSHSFDHGSREAV